MSDHWEFFPCLKGKHRAFVFYDHGIRAELDRLEITRLVKVKLPLRSADTDGLPASEEVPVLASFEKSLEELIEAEGGSYVGRITVDGARYFHCYCDTPEAELKDRVFEIGELHGYGVACFTSEDPERKAYREELYPSDHDWQVIQDSKTLQNLEKSGDPLSKERRIDHLSVFPRRSDLEGFRSWAVNTGFEVDAVYEPDEEIADYSIRIYHTAVPRYNEISNTTVALLQKAREFNGAYDGWETSVEKD